VGHASQVPPVTLYSTVGNSPVNGKGGGFRLQAPRDSGTLLRQNGEHIQTAQVNPCNPPETPRITRTPNSSGWVPGLIDLQ